MAAAPTGTQLLVGGILTTDGTAKTGKIRNLTVYKLAQGMAIHNQGTSGWTAANGVTNIATVTAWTPDVVVLGFGTNDVRTSRTLAAYIADLTSMCNTLTTAGIYPVLASIPPLAGVETGSGSVPTWNESIRSLSISLGVGFWDRWSALNGDTAWLADGVHPTAAGSQNLAHSAYRVLTEQAPAWQ